MKSFAHSIRVSAAIFTSSSLSFAVSLSGKVVNQDANASGKSGVTVTLVGTNLSTTTDDQGVWSLSGSTGISPSISLTRPLTEHLTVDRGYLRFDYQGRDLGGRKRGHSSTTYTQPRFATSRAYAGPDYLSYSINGKVFLLDTIWNQTQSGIIRVFDTTVNTAITYGYIKDERDGQIYRTVTIGPQIWFAQNLNYRTSNSWWLNNSPDSGAKYGRLYQWASAMSLPDSCNNVSTCSSSEWPPKSACPSGWRIPTYYDWDTLIQTVDSDTSGKRMFKENITLESTSGWLNFQAGIVYPNGTDVWGFKVLPAGKKGRFSDTTCCSGNGTSFWSTREPYPQTAMIYSCDKSSCFFQDSFNKDNSYSVRCVLRK